MHCAARASKMISRRGFLRGLFAAPAVVAFANLMPVRGLIVPIVPEIITEPDISFQITGWANIERQIAEGYAITRKAIDDNLFKERYRFQNGLWTIA